jgi:hypothetical protein
MTKKNCTPKKGRIIQINEEGVREHLGEDRKRNGAGNPECAVK